MQSGFAIDAGFIMCQQRRGKLAVIYGFGFMCFQNENGAGRQPAQGLQGEGGLLSTATMIGGICK